MTQTTEYDSMGRATTVTDALGTRTYYSYDAMGNVLETVRSINEGERRVSYAYDKLGRITSVTDPLEGVTRTTYDSAGNVKTLTDANGGVTEYAYDSMGQLIETISPLGNRYSYTYNAAGLLEESLNAREQSTTYHYDKVGRITSMTDELGTVHYTYDPNGNILKVTDDQGTISRKYDALNRVTEYTDYKGNTVKYGYDEIGNLIALTYPGGEIVRYTYYKNGWLHTVTDAKGNVTKYTYDARGNLTHTERPNGTEEICTYNEAGLLVSQKDVCGEEVLTEYTYTYDENGNITTLKGTETTGTEEGISRLSSAEMTYNEENRLLTYNGRKIRYDADGNMTYGPINGVMTELVYDCRNRLVSAGNITYFYDAENNRIAMEDGEYREEYVTDTVSSSLSRVLMSSRRRLESEQSEESMLYIYGSGLIYEYSGDIYLYHHYNNLGSTMKLTDEHGDVVASYTYGAYGELLSGDTSLTRFLYNGRCGVTTDDNGLYYMRQRYYNPEIKRFVNQDILTGSMGNSQSLNRYSYVQGNPVSYTDPFGLSPLGGLFTGTGLAHGILGILGCLPGIPGAIFNGIDAWVYAAIDKDYFMATMAGLSAVSLGVGSIAKWAGVAAKAGTRGAKVFGYMATMGTYMSNGIEFAQNGVQTAVAAYDAWNVYTSNGNSFGYNDIGTVANVGLSALATIWSGVNVSKTSKSVNKMLNEVDASSYKKAAMQHGDVIKANTYPTPCGIEGGQCFVAGTPIKTIEGNKCIEEIQVGDLVYAKNPESGESGWKKVVHLFVKESTTLIHIQVGDEVIDTTPTHPFWVDGYGFKAAEDLVAGDYVELASGELLRITSVEKEYLTEPVTVYNFEVEDWHTYYVSDKGILVHNMCLVGSTTTSNKSGNPSSGYQFKDGIDVDMRGNGSVEDALEEAFRRLQEPRENFYVTKWAENKNEYGKSVPVEWTSTKTQAQVNIDPAHIKNPDAPQIPHVGYQTGGKKKRGGKTVGHIFVDEVIYHRPQKK